MIFLILFLSFFSFVCYYLWKFYVAITYPPKDPFKGPKFTPINAKEKGIKKRIAIIGAGVSGLTSIKACLEEGQDPVCFERSSDVGGLWRYTDFESHSSIMESTIINTSKQLMSFSDFPVPDNFPIFMHQTECFKYFQLYADNFKLLPYVTFNTSVKKVIPIGNTGRYKLVLQKHTKAQDPTKSDNNYEEGEITEEEFDGVMVCSGHHWDPHIPHFKGQENFKGKILHSHTYKKPFPDYIDKKKFLIVGIGNSGVDIAVELSRVGKTYLSTRRGSWVVGRHGMFGKPLDHEVSRFVTVILPVKVLNFIAKLQSFVLWGNLSKINLFPKHEPFSSHVTVHSELVGRCHSGRLNIKPNIQEIKENSVIFEDGSEVEDIDVIILCTGYSISYPFFDESVLKFHNNYHPVYKLILPLNSTYKSDSHQHEILEKSESIPGDEIVLKNLCLVGLVQPAGTIMPLSELQARWFVQYMIGALELPDAREIIKEIHERKRKMRERYYESQRHTIQVDFLKYADEVGQDLGLTFENFWEVSERYGTKFALRWLFKFGSPIQYRLKGPHKWDGAKNYLDNLWDRM